MTRNNFLAHIASLFNTKARRLVKQHRASLATLKQQIADGDWYWFYVTSASDFKQIEPIIDRLKKEHSQAKILLTFSSLTDYELLQNYSNADLVLFLPLSTRRTAKRFISIVNPKKAIIVGNEFEAAYLKQLKNKVIETYNVASVFSTQKELLKCRKYRRLLRCFTTILVQDEVSQNLLSLYGIENSIVCGEPYWGKALSVANSQSKHPLLDKFISGMPEYQTIEQLQISLKYPVLVAAHTLQSDEHLLSQYLNSHPQIRLILSPHTIDEQHLHDIFRTFEGRYMLLSQATLKNIDTTRLLIVDKPEFLPIAYRYADIAYIGGGFQEGVYGIIDAAAYGIPVVWGKNYHHSRQAIALLQAGAGLAASHPKHLHSTLDDAFAKKQDMGQKTKELVLSEIDAVDKIYSQLGF